MPKRKDLELVPAPKPLPATTGALLADLRSLIEAARAHTAQAVNVGLVRLYWSIGTRIRHEVLKGKRARYGEQIVSAVGRQLSLEYGRGFSEKTLRHMLERKLYEAIRLAREQIAHARSIRDRTAWSRGLVRVPETPERGR